MPTCETTDFRFPLLADVYYPIVEQGAYGDVKRQWILDKTIACSFAPMSSKTKEDVKPNVAIMLDQSLIGRVRSDIRVSSLESNNAITNVLITNIRDTNGNLLYLETAGVRANKSTIFEVATSEPIIGPFKKLEYYKLIIRRSENQAVGV